ncbi:MAG: hypothetical protein K2H52_07940 [Lachnospiraceae bacterium]|nr:hypothetical protein [Lachnospiraceae bacterium]
MSMMIGSRSSNVTKYTLKKPDGSVAGSITIRKPEQKKLKRLQYNFKEISTLIMRTRTSSNARQVMSKAFIKVMGLRSKLRTGQYDDKEVQSAILHAEQLTRVARKRMKHLREEENAKKHGGVCEGDLDEKTLEIDLDEEALEELEDTGMSEEELRELMQELEEQLQELERVMSDANGLEDLSDELMPTEERSLDPEDLELLKKKHRAEELRDIMEADMKYLKAMFEKLAKEKQEASSHSGSNTSDAVSLELGGMEVPVETMDIPVPTSGENVDLMA